MTIHLLMPYQVAKVREGLVQYGDVTPATLRRAVTCRCCGLAIAKGEAALRFAWDFNGNGSWTATTCYMHPACEPAPEEIREAVNRAALIRELEGKLEKLEDRLDLAVQRKTRMRLERAVANVAQHLKGLREVIK